MDELIDGINKKNPSGIKPKDLLDLEFMLSSNIKYQIFKVDITSANQIVETSFQIKKDYQKVIGLYADISTVTTGNENSNIGIIIDQNEIFPNDFELRVLRSTQAIPPTLRFYPLYENGDGCTVKVRYVDKTTVGTPTYSVTLCFKLLKSPINDIYIK